MLYEDFPNKINSIEEHLERVANALEKLVELETKKLDTEKPYSSLEASYNSHL